MDIKRPLLKLFIAICLGMVFAYNFDMEKINFAASLIIISLGIYVTLSKDKLRNIISYILLFLAVFFISSYLFINDYNSSNYTENQKINEIFIVEEDISVSKTPKKRNKFKYIIKSVATKEKLVLNLDKNKALKPGNFIKVKSKIEKPNSNTNPMLFNYKSYLKSKYIHSVINSKSNHIKIVKRKSKKRFSHIFIETVEDYLDSLFSSVNAAIMKSVIIGNSKYIEKDRLNSIRNTGLAHFLAISGFHIGIIYIGCLKIFTFGFKISKRISQTVSIVIIYIYISAIGFPVSAVRAILMIFILTLSQFLHKRTDMLNTIGACGSTILLLKPLYILSLSFQLSFLGVISIAILSPKIKVRKYGLNKLIAVFIGIGPISISYFNSYSPVYLLSNLLLGGIFSLSVFSTIISMFLFSINIKIGKFISIIPENLLNIMNNTIDFLNIEGFEIRTLGIIELVFIYISIAIYFRIIDIDRIPKKFIEILFTSSIITSLLLSFFIKDENIYIRFIDVGQGDSIWIEHKNRNYLIDSGGSVFSDFDTGEMIINPLLKKKGIKKIDVAVISHFDADHAKGFITLLDNRIINKIHIGHIPEENKLYKEISKKSKKKGIEIVNSNNQYRVSAGELNMTLMPPSSKFKKIEDENNNSLVVLLEGNGRSALFTGDIEKERELDLLREIDKHEKFKEKELDIIKVPHHGSKTSSTEKFLDALRPKIAIIQCGKNNYGHPDEQVLERYRNINSKVYRNDLDGYIEIIIEKDGRIEVESYLKRNRTLKYHIRSNSDTISIIILYIIISYYIVINLREHYEGSINEL